MESCGWQGKGSAREIRARRKWREGKGGRERGSAAAAAAGTRDAPQAEDEEDAAAAAGTRDFAVAAGTRTTKDEEEAGAAGRKGERKRATEGRYVAREAAGARR